MGFGIDFRIRDIDYASLRKLVAQWREVITNYFGDFYPITRWSRDTTHWIAWQFDRPEEKTGLIQVFRREDSPYETINLKLRAIDSSAKYKIQDIDNPDKTQIITGSEILKKGFFVKIDEQPGVATLIYNKL